LTLRLTVVNPNTSQETTAAMVAIASEVAGEPVRGVTARRGPRIIMSPAALAEAAQAVVELVPELVGAQAVIVAAFGDPGLEALRSLLSCPVTGIAEAGMVEAAALSPRFAVVTTTPDLADSINAKAEAAGYADFAGTWITDGDPATVMGNPDLLVAALDAACRRAITQGGARAIVIGGGPLAVAARALAGTLPVPLVEPVPAAVRLSLSRRSQVTP
jgi:Asp/Glu/hydantoin racemase